MQGSCRVSHRVHARVGCRPLIPASKGKLMTNRKDDVHTKWKYSVSESTIHPLSMCP